MAQRRIPAVYMRGGTSKVVIVAKSARPDADVDFLFGAVAMGLVARAEDATVRRAGGRWVVTRVVVSRSARRLMEGWVLLPQD